MCRFYNSSAYISCDHERAEPPVIKESANFCDYFKPANRFDSKGATRAAAARSDLDSLFGEQQEVIEDKVAKKDLNDPAEKLNDLFGD